MIFSSSTFLRHLFLGAALLAGVRSAQAGSEPAALIPMPSQIEARPGTVHLGPDWAISALPKPEDAWTTRILIQELHDGYAWDWPIASAGSRLRTIELREIAPPAGLPALFAEQGYRLKITRTRIVIEGASAQGRFYGVQTLRQLLRAHPDGVIPCAIITDYPALAWRGISDDISRGQVSTVDDFKAIIRQLAYYKINLYQPYIEDVFRANDSTTSGVLTRTDLEQLVEEGVRNHVVVSPIFETLTHQERMLSRLDAQRLAVPEVEVRTESSPQSTWTLVVRRASKWFGRLVVPSSSEIASPASFSASNPQALLFVQSLVDQIASITGGPFFHLGGDEWQPPTLPATASMSEREDAVHGYGRYLGRIAEHVHQRFGCRAIVYGDVILDRPEAARDLPRDVIVMDWHYDPQDSFPSVRQIRQEGFRDVMVSPGLWTWRTFYPNFAAGFANVAAFAQVGKREGVMGCVTAAWGDGGAENLRENNWPGYAFSAAASWEVSAPATDPFLKRYAVAQYGTASPELPRVEKLLGWQEFESIGWVGRLYHRPLVVRALPQQAVERMKSLEADMRQVEQELSASENAVRFNRDHLAAARHTANRYLYMAEREMVLDEVGRKLGDGTSAQLSPSDRDKIALDFGRLEGAANALEVEYRRLWLSHNRPEGLDVNEARLARQAEMLRRLRKLALSGSLRVDDSFSHLQALSVTR